MVSRPLRIVHLIATASGAPWLVSIVREQRRRGHDVIVVLVGRDGTLAPIFEAEGVPCHVAAFDLGPAFAWTLSKLVRLLRRLRADVAMYHLYQSIILGRLAGWMADVPLRFSMIPGTFYLEVPTLGQLDAQTAWADTRVIATCQRTRELYVEYGIPRAHVDVMYYGLDATRFDPAVADGAKVRRELHLREHQPVIGLVAYFYPPGRSVHLLPSYLLGKGVKGHETVLAAIPQVIAKYPDAMFVFVGKGWGPLGEEYQASVKQRAVDLGVANHVIFTGERPDVPDVLASFDIALQVSLSENLGGSIEALTMARPMIATRVGGLVDSVKHERTGLLVEPEDAPGLAAAILRLLGDRAYAAGLADAGRAFMLEGFTVQKTCDDLDALYDDMMREGQFEAGRPPNAGRYRWTVSAARISAFPIRQFGLVRLMAEAWGAWLLPGGLRRVRGLVLAGIPAPLRRLARTLVVRKAAVGE